MDSKETAKKVAEDVGQFAKEEGRRIAEETIVTSYRKTVRPMLTWLRWTVRVISVFIAAIFLAILILIAKSIVS